MVDFRIVSKIIGQLLLLESGLMAICLVMALCYGEDDLTALSVSVVATVCAGLMCKYFGRNAGNDMNRRGAYLVVTATWVVFSLFGMLPFLIGGYITNVADAYFETMSGFTTTGATILDNVEALPHGILFWRSLTQWIGGLGIVFFTIAVLPSVVGGSLRVFAAEATGPMKTKMHPRLSMNAKWIWTIYIALTVACAFAFRIAGMDWFDSANYSMSTTATGGFSTHNDSTVFFHSAAIEYVAIFFQFIAGMNFTLLYIAIFKGNVRKLAYNSEFRLYLSVVAIATVWIMWLLMSRCGYDCSHALRSALFQVVSFITTTGMFNDNAETWPHITWVILSGCMFLGACAGSTSGGFKCVRGVMTLKVMRNEFRRILHPNAVLPIKMNGQNVPQSHVPTLLTFFVFYIIVCLIAAVIMIAAGIDNTNAVTIALSCMSNVGPTLGTAIGPVMSWSTLPDGIKWVCSFLMLVGRLEIMSVLVLFTRSFWKDS